MIVARDARTAAAVSLAGTIGWVGLLDPARGAARSWARAFARVLPLSLVLGAGVHARRGHARAAPPSRTEIPPGVVTAFVGTPVFIVLLAVDLPARGMTLAARALDFGFRGRVVGRGRGPRAARRARSSACSVPTAAARRTLLRTLLGLLPPLAGEVTLDGRALAQMAARASAPRASRTCRRPPRAISTSACWRWWRWGAPPIAASSPRPGARDRAAVARGARAPGHRGARRAPDPSRERRRAPARAHRPRARHARRPHLLMDEPTANLDFGNQALILDEIARLRKARAPRCSSPPTIPTTRCASPTASSCCAAVASSPRARTAGGAQFAKIFPRYTARPVRGAPR